MSSGTTVDSTSDDIGTIVLSKDDCDTSASKISGSSPGEVTSTKKCTSCVDKIAEEFNSVAILNDTSACANCANCGKDNATNKCNKCMLVKYCNAACKKKHRSKHKKACERQVTELYDEALFKQPPPIYGDCPICFVRMPTLSSGRTYNSCCGKVICNGCIHAPLYDDQGDEVDNEKCPFCRTSDPTLVEEVIQMERKRMEKDDPVAIHNVGCCYRDGSYGCPQDMNKALELFHRAGELGYTTAYCCIGYAYDHGRGVEVDKKKTKYYYELAAMGGNEVARHNLGSYEARAGNMDRALKHYLIAAASGYSGSLEMIQMMYKDGDASKDDYMKSLQSYQAYLEEIKSDQRDKAAAADDDYRYY